MLSYTTGLLLYAIFGRVYVLCGGTVPSLTPPGGLGWAA